MGRYFSLRGGPGAVFLVRAPARSGRSYLFFVFCSLAAGSAGVVGTMMWA